MFGRENTHGIRGLSPKGPGGSGLSTLADVHDRQTSLRGAREAHEKRRAVVRSVPKKSLEDFHPLHHSYSTTRVRPLVPPSCAAKLAAALPPDLYKCGGSGRCVNQRGQTWPSEFQISSVRRRSAARMHVSYFAGNCKGAAKTFTACDDCPQKVLSFD